MLEENMRAAWNDRGEGIREKMSHVRTGQNLFQPETIEAMLEGHDRAVTGMTIWS